MKITTISGQYLDILDPGKYKFTVEEIANCLSHISRFTGHVNRPYSVTEHSILLSLLVPEEYSRSALFHDAAEAFIGDHATPIKALIPNIKEIEDRILLEISKQLNFTMPGDLVHHFDKILTLSEGKYFMPHFDDSHQKEYQAIDFEMLSLLYKSECSFFKDQKLNFINWADNHNNILTAKCFEIIRNQCLEQIDAIGGV